ncbi:PAS domain S-box protein [Telluribacter sp.]|jgi:PAS domain S-box-containing protein|uniref:PAS domain-containing sensor histidine kinase n=1 Tax=Telluribacter sp. TaxID=1978767 RepID=UPI002E0DB62D|nr:PAS domain S-box protein [Telluribacter sp.]
MQDDYQLLIDSIKDYAIYMLDVEGRITTWNVGAQRMKGYSTEEVLGKNFSMFFIPEDQENEKPLMELSTALTRGRYEEEGWRMRKDGKRFWANIIITPIYDEGRKHIGFAKVTRDLTEKRRNEELYLLLVNQVKEYAIFMLDTTGDILTWNEGAERIKGYAAYEIIGQHFSIFYPAEDKAADKPANELAIAIRTGKYEEEGWRIRKDGSRFWASVTISPIYTDSHIGFSKVTRDLTRRKEMEQLTRANLILEATNKELERFAVTASHDLKEPLRKIQIFSSRVVEDKTNPPHEKHREFLDKIIVSSQRMNTMIEEILNYSSLSQKQHFQKSSLETIIKESLELLENAIEGKKATVKYSQLPEAIVIPSQMGRLFQNLISNSLKFSRKEEAPLITITWEFLDKEMVDSDEIWPAEQYLQIQFRDNGIGFEQEYAERIFNLFDRLHNKSTYEGTGVGLAICRKIVENHGGTIKAQSSPGEGAEFTIIIPA